MKSADERREEGWTAIRKVSEKMRIEEGVMGITAQFPCNIKEEVMTNRYKELKKELKAVLDKDYYWVDEWKGEK